MACFYHFVAIYSCNVHRSQKSPKLFKIFYFKGTTVRTSRSKSFKIIHVNTLHQAPRNFVAKILRFCSRLEAHNKDFMIFACTVLIRLQAECDRRIDGRTDGRTDGRRPRR